MIHLPSIRQIASTASAAIRRFPFVLSFAILGTFGVIWLMDLPWGASDEHYLIRNFCWISALSISFFLAIKTVSEGRNWNPLKLYLTSAAAMLILAVYFLVLPDNFKPSGSEAFYRYILLFLASHLLVSFAPFFGTKHTEDFWAYNKTLFLRILLSALYVAVLFSGLSIAIYSLEALLEFNIPGKRYGQLAVFLIGIFGTWFFLAGVPKPGYVTDEEKSYPKGLRVFVQYVLIPLVVVYIFILYLYMGKILIEWQWPTGWVAVLVLSFSIAGILGLLLLYPIQDEEGRKWVRLFSKGFYIALIPLVLLLVLSIWVRISDYGVTVNRFFVATLAVWLGGMVLYFLFSKKKDIRVIPASLFLIALLISFGPLGAFKVSERSQLGRLEANLEKHGLLSDSGTVIPAEQEIPFNDRKQISSGVNYLIELKGPQTLQPYFEQDLREMLANKDSTEYMDDARFIVSLMGIAFVYDWEQESGTGAMFPNFQYQRNGMDPVNLSGYDHYVGVIEIWFNSVELETGIGEYTYSIAYIQETLEIHVREKPTERTLLFELKPVVDEIGDSGEAKIATLPADKLTMERQSGPLRIKLVFNSLGGQVQHGEITGLHANFGLYFSVED